MPDTVTTVDSYTITVSGTGVSEADAKTAYDTLVLALRAATGVGGTEPHGTLKHSEATTIQAEDVAA